MTATTHKEWFATWFDTSYYHLLYQHRNDSEAQAFIHRLTDYLLLTEGAHVLDLACGKGRHSKTLHALGYEVLGVDLSPNSIQSASESQQEKLRFAVHDMREVINGVRFEAVFNLFTSFGYFQNIEDNQRVFDAVASMLTDEGVFIIDFMNAKKVIAHLKPEEEVLRHDVKFNLKRFVEEKHIVKTIEVRDNDKSSYFQERVQALYLEDFKQMAEISGFELMNTFGDYALSPFDEVNSDRLILHFKRQAQ